jgi:ABC-type sugar transport system ATPase subunit
MAEVLVKRLHKAFPDGTVAVEELDLEIADGELFVLLGPSGCGKTTTLRCVAGLEQETSGQIVIGDEVVSGLRPSQRDIAMVFQFYALYPHLSVRDNMAFPLRAAKMPDAEITERVNEAARMLQLEPYLTRKPNKLSGGEQQRVALGRAMVRHPKAFLMDEPLTNLDAELRADMRAELKHVQQRLHSTMIYVTHDQTEAMALGDRIAIMNKGNLEQLGAPMEVYNRPATLFAARFIGSPPMNLVEAEVTNGVLTAAGGLTIAAPDGLERGQKVIAGVRPERFAVAAEGEGARGRVVSREALGDETIYVVETEAGLLNVRMPPTARFAEEQAVSVRHVGAPPPAYDPQTEKVVSAPPVAMKKKVTG